MAKRGRPKHPDILTPREWEVLALVRDGLSNEEIASRLGISVDGAKYHVSQILMKLGVRDRLEAAGWRPEEERPRLWSAFGAPFVAFAKLRPSIVSYAVLAGLTTLALAGIGVLVWGLAATNHSTSETPTGGDAQIVESDYPPLPGPTPNAEVVRVSEEIATSDDPVFYVRDPEDRERVIAYDWEGQWKGALIISSSEPYGFHPSLDGTVVLLAYADAHIRSGGEAVGTVSVGGWSGDNEHLCVFLNELGGPGAARQRQISETMFEGQPTAARLFLQNLSGERRPVIDFGAFNFHGGPALLACDTESDRAVIAESFVGHLSNLRMVRLSDGKVIYEHPETSAGFVASRDGSLLAEGSTAGNILGSSFVVRHIPGGEEAARITGGGIVAFSDDNSRVLIVQYLNRSNEFGRYRVVDLATSRVIWERLLAPGNVWTRPNSSEFIVGGSSWEPSGAPDGRRDRFEDLWLIPEDGRAQLLLVHTSPVR